MVRNQESVSGVTQSTRGRTLFRRYYFAIRILTGLLSILPRAVIIRVWSLVNGFDGKLGIGIRYCLAKILARSCGENVLIARNVEIIGWDLLEIGNNVSIHKDCYVDAKGGLIIGSDVSIAHQTSIITFNHTWKNRSIPIRDNPIFYKSVVISDDVWIGCGCRILAGCSLGKRVVVAAGAVVTNSVPDNTLVAGIPARSISKI